MGYFPRAWRSGMLSRSAWSGALICVLIFRSKELRLVFCPQTTSGMKQFVEKSYLSLKGANPTTPILVRPAQGATPFAVARYEMGVEEKVSLQDADAAAVEKAISKLTT